MSKRKRVICPECKGDKKMMYCKGSHVKGNELCACEVCGGEGIVFRKVEITYERIS